MRWLLLACVLLVVQHGVAAETVLAELDSARLGPQRTAMVAGLVDRLRQRAWQVSVVDDDGIPAGWQATRGGIHLRIMAAPPAADLWVLPPDWIGLRRPSGDPWRLELVRRGGLLMALTRTEPSVQLRQRLQELLPDDGVEALQWRRQILPSTPEQTAAYDRAAQALIARFCPDSASLVTAIDSFLELGIPAPTVYAAAARSAERSVVKAGIAALGELGGAEACDLLLAVLAREDDDPATRFQQPRAAWALARIAEPRCGPALLASLRHLRDGDTVRAVVEALERSEHRPAADAILALLAAASRRQQQGDYAKALATLRHEAALPLLRRICGDAPITGETLVRLRAEGAPDRQPEVALLRLAAPWGPLAGGVRLLLVPCARTVVGRGSAVVLLIENQGAEERDAIPYLGGEGGTALIIDGVRHAVEPGSFCGSFTIQQHGTWVHVCPLDALITTPGSHRISYHTSGATSNEVVIDVVPAPVRRR